MSSGGHARRASRIWQVLLDRIARVAQATAVRTQAGRLRPLWRVAYELLARAVGLILIARQPSASVYVAGGMAAGEPVYGHSDIDLVIVTSGTDQVRRRWGRLRRGLPTLGELFADLSVYSPAELNRAARDSTLTQTEGPVYLGRCWARDERGLRERPGLVGAAVDWRLLQGHDQRPAVAVMDPQQLRIAAWLELQFWWRMAMQFAIQPTHHQSPYAALKLIAHSARAWLAVEHGELPERRGEILAAALRRLPEEEAVLRWADTLAADPGHYRDARWDLVVPALVRFSDRVAGSFETAATAAGRLDVRLSGIPQTTPLPLLDWRGLVLPERPDEAFIPASGDPGRPSVLAGAVHDSATSYRGLRSGRLLVLAAGEPWTRSFLRAVACPATDPVSFALLGGADSARFPQLAGWSVADMARRAVEEHRGWLEQSSEDGVLADRAWLDGRQAGTPGPLRVAAKLLTAARAAVLEESIREQSPELAVSVAAIGSAMAERHPSALGSAHEVAGAYARGDGPERGALRQLRQELRETAAYASHAAAHPLPA